MKIAVLSRNPRLYSTRRLVEAGTERGHEMVVIDTLRAYMNIASHKPQIHYRGKPLEGFDAVIGGDRPFAGQTAFAAAAVAPWHWFAGHRLCTLPG
jgi:predicted membrane-bound mannosyltransferase